MWIRVSWIGEFVRDGKVPAIAAGRKIFFFEKDVEKVLFDGKYYYVHLRQGNSFLNQFEAQPPSWAVECKVERRQTHPSAVACSKCGKIWDTDTILEVIIEDGAFECDCGNVIYPFKVWALEVTIPEDWQEQLAQNLAQVLGFTKLVWKAFESVGGGEYVQFSRVIKDEKLNERVQFQVGEDPKILYSSWDEDGRKTVAEHRGTFAYIKVQELHSSITQNFLFAPS